MEHGVIEIERVGRTFEFRLCRRDLTLGSARTAIRVPYYWMGLPELRERGGGPNARPCLDLWWAMTEAQSFVGDERFEAEVMLVLAELYPYVARDRGPQRVFSDALLKPGAYGGEREYSLPAAEWRRLLKVCRAQDPAAIDREARSLLIDNQPSADEMPDYQKACQAWVGNGIAALRRGGVGALRGYAQSDMTEWIRRYRRRGKLVRVRLFIDMLSAEAAAAFRVCYANAWAQIIATLVAKGLLDPLGERLHRFWHNVVRVEDRDLFAGLVPALHPLSERIFRSSDYREALRAWLHSASARGVDNWECPEFWDVFAVILAAAAEHKHLRNEQNSKRRKPEPEAEQEGVHQAAEDDVVADQFAAYAADRSLACSVCGSRVKFTEVHPDDDRESGVRIRYECVQCEQPGEVEA